jgi:hypothetical protein
VITAENGYVSRTRYGKRYTIWVRCSECGPTPPQTRVVPHAVSGELMLMLALAHPPSVLFLPCSRCGRDGPRRECLIPERTSQNGRCGKKCWNGKYECACICQGKCHSEESCFCKEGVSP